MDAKKIGYLPIRLRLRGFQHDVLKWHTGIPRGKNSESLIHSPVQQDRREKISLEVNFSTAGEVTWFPVFIPADDKYDTYKPEMNTNGKYSLEIREGQEGVIVVVEPCGENEFQITLITLWDPIEISSCFGNRDAITRHFSGQRREFVLRTIAAMDYRAAEKQRAAEERQKRLEEKRREEERKRSEEEKKQERKRGLLGQLMSLTRGGWKSR